LKATQKNLITRSPYVNILNNITRFSYSHN